MPLLALIYTCYPLKCVICAGALPSPFLFLVTFLWRNRSQRWHRRGCCVVGIGAPMALYATVTMSN